MIETDHGRAGGVEPLDSPFRVGEWLAEPAWNRIRRATEVVKLEPRVMRLLATLAAVSGRPLQRQELLDSVWPNTIVNEEALSRAISQLRRALRDDAKSPRYLQTVHKGGYCLIAPVAAASAPAAGSPRQSGSKVSTPVLWMLFGLLLAGLAALLFYQRPDPSAEPSALRRLVPLTSEPGREIDPAISPDGKRVAYFASTAAGYQLLVRGMDGGASRRLTNSSLAKGHLAWSPAGDRIAFVGADGPAAAIYVLPLSGGEAEKLITLTSWSYGLDWSPDGATLAYSDAAAGETAGIVLLDFASKAMRPVARSASSAGDVKPAFSPDGNRLAFLRVDGLERQQIALVDLHRAGTAELLAVPPQDLKGVDWAPDGKSLLFSARSGRRYALWRVKTATGAAAQPVPTEGGDLLNPSISRTGRIVVEEVEQDRDIWRAGLGSQAAAPLVSSTSDDQDPAFAPAGARLAFISERSGAPEIWIQETGREARRLTRLASEKVGQLQWSPSGDRIAFVAEIAGKPSIYAADSSSGRLTRLLARPDGRIPIGWSADGDRLFMLAPSGNRWTLEEFALGGATSRAMSAPAIRVAAVSADGKWIFAVPASENILLQIAPGRGIVRQFRLPSIHRLDALLAARDAVYVVEDVLGTATIYRVGLRSGEVRSVASLEYYGGGSLSLAPDHRSLAYTRARETANDLAWTRL